MRLSGSERRTLIIAATLLSCIFFYQFALQPALERIGGYGEAGGAPSGTEELLASAGSIRAAHDRLEKTTRELIRQFLPDTSQDQGGLSLLALVEETAARANLTLLAKGIRRPEAAGRDAPPGVAVEITGKGKAASLVKFLAGLQSLDRRVDVSRLEIAAVENGLLEMHMIIAAVLPGAGEGMGDD